MRKSVGRKLREVTVLSWGKVRRFFQATLFRGAIKKSEARREGQCLRCGACCKLVYKCPALFYTEDGLAACKYHKARPLNCRVFPVGEKDLADRNLILPDIPCGYSFKSGGDGVNNEPEEEQA